jgi:hypothetical protein
MKLQYLLLFAPLLVFFTLSCSSPKEMSNAPGKTVKATYGYSEKPPIKVAGLADSGPLCEKAYLERLTGPNGEKILYTRKGSCCEFKTKNSPFGSGLLDMYEVTYRGLGKTVILYLNMYDPADKELKAPASFKLK